MKPIEYYAKVTAPYPDRRALTTTFWYREGAVFAKKMPGWNTPRQAEGGFTLAADGQILKTLPSDSKLDQAEYDRIADAYRQERQRLEEEFYFDALNKVGVAGDPAAHVIFSKAYDEGHACGHAEVLSRLRSLAHFVHEVDVARAQKK